MVILPLDITIFQYTYAWADSSGEHIECDFININYTILLIN